MKNNMKEANNGQHTKNSVSIDEGVMAVEILSSSY
jgi:hypothetical protein